MIYVLAVTRRDLKGFVKLYSINVKENGTVIKKILSDTQEGMTHEEQRGL